MKLTRLLALFCATFLFFSCGSNKYSVDKLPTKFIELGNGGGFTGEYHETSAMAFMPAELLLANTSYSKRN